METSQRKSDYDTDKLGVLEKTLKVCLPAILFKANPQKA